MFKGCIVRRDAVQEILISSSSSSSSSSIMPACIKHRFFFFFKHPANPRPPALKWPPFTGHIKSKVIRSATG